MFKAKLRRREQHLVKRSIAESDAAWVAIENAANRLKRSFDGMSSISSSAASLKVMPLGLRLRMPPTD